MATVDYSPLFITDTLNIICSYLFTDELYALVHTCKAIRMAATFLQPEWFSIAVANGLSKRSMRKVDTIDCLTATAKIGDLETFRFYFSRSTPFPEPLITISIKCKQYRILDYLLYFYEWHRDGSCRILGWVVLPNKFSIFRVAGEYGDLTTVDIIVERFLKVKNKILERSEESIRTSSEGIITALSIELLATDIVLGACCGNIPVLDKYTGYLSERLYQRVISKAKSCKSSFGKYLVKAGYTWLLQPLLLKNINYWSYSAIVTYIAEYESYLNLKAIVAHAYRRLAILKYLHDKYQLLPSTSCFKRVSHETLSQILAFGIDLGDSIKSNSNTYDLLRLLIARGLPLTGSVIYDSIGLAICCDNFQLIRDLLAHGAELKTVLRVCKELCFLPATYGAITSAIQ